MEKGWQHIFVCGIQLVIEWQLIFTINLCEKKKICKSYSAQREWNTSHLFMAAIV